MNQEIKLGEVGECYELYINGTYKKLFNNYFEAYKNLLDAEDCVELIRQIALEKRENNVTKDFKKDNNLFE